MAWRPGPPPSPGLPTSDYDQRDPWTQRFISKTDGGELSLDVNAMNGLETAAGEVFVELIRQQAERPPSPIESPWSSWKPGQTSTGSGYLQHHPSAMRVESPMAQYKPFRCTYVSDPACVPQLRFANVSDTGADHHKRETTHHWRRAGRTWSRVPRFRKSEAAFKHDPEYKTPHAVKDKWYRTEAGPKLSLAGRVQESRWQSCHSMQSGREPRQPTRSRMPREPKRPQPGPASYNLQDPWEVKQVCGTVPKSSMFCEPVRRLRPRTTVFACPTSSSCEMSVDSSVATGADEYGDDSIARRQSYHARSVTASANQAATGRPLFPTYPYPQNNPPKRAGDLTRGGTEMDRCYRPGRKNPSAARTATTPLAGGGGVGAHGRGGQRRRPPTIGPSSFARAERPNITDERRRREDSYHSRAVRLLTGSGDVLVTVNRRRTSAWGTTTTPNRAEPAPHLDRARTTAGRGSNTNSNSNNNNNINNNNNNNNNNSNNNASRGNVRREEEAAAASRVGGRDGDGRNLNGDGRIGSNAFGEGRAGNSFNSEGRIGRKIDGDGRIGSAFNGKGPIRSNFKRGKQRKGENRGGGRGSHDAPLSPAGANTTTTTTTTTVRTRPSGVLTLQKNVFSNGTLEAEAIKLLPADLASALPAYREPGRAQLPLIFRATSAPIVKSNPAPVRAVSVVGGGARRGSRRPRSLSTAIKGGVIMDADGPVDDFRDQREENGRAANLQNALEEAKDTARNPSMTAGGGSSGSSSGGGGGGGGGGQTSIMAKIPLGLGQSSGLGSTGRAPATEERRRQENSTTGSYDTVSVAMLSGDETDSPRLR